ncbi:NAD(P)-dependent oxidoreductase [Chitinimonas taiwanensis]|uniref:NAD(P)-dependent oxidoreductase n=1 Tax=Chitinimonas taiwanensis TaxID=240412 RepID=UPI0035ADABB6
MTLAVSVLGVGAMGSRMAARLILAGYRVTVWNRSPSKAQALADAGARLAPTPREAAVGADFVIAMVRDDEASRYVWCDPDFGALAGMKEGAVAIESSTLSLAFIRKLAHAAETAGVHFLEAPVSGSRPAAEAGQLVYLVGGEAAVYQLAAPVLKTMGASIQHIGAVGHGAVAKLITNTLLGIHVASLAELIGLLGQQGVAVDRVLQSVAGTPVWAPVDHYLAGSMLAEDFKPQFPIELIAKDFAYTAAAAGSGAQIPMVSAAMQVFEQALGRHLGGENMTAVARLYTPPREAVQSN